VEVWLPVRQHWNTRFKGLGSGGLGGVLPYGTMARDVEHGYAVAATDTGHAGYGFDGAFALGHPEKIIDYGFRATHLTALTGEAFTSTYYGKSPTHTYFEGCSQGGQEGLMSRAPQSRDGTEDLPIGR